MIRNTKHWANNFAGLFGVAVTMFVVVLAMSRHEPRAETSAVLWLLGAMGICSLVAWTWLAHRAGGSNAERALFKTH